VTEEYHEIVMGVGIQIIFELGTSGTRSRRSYCYVIFGGNGLLEQAT